MSQQGQARRRLLDDPRIWKLRAGTTAPYLTIPTGWAGLDNALDGGWPVGQLIEILVDGYGRGEFTLLMPALRRLTARDDQSGAATGWAVVIAPPYLPYAPALAHSGLDLSRLLLVRAGGDIDALWAMEQALSAGSCSAVVGWARSVQEKYLRRLQLAAESSKGWVVLFRPARVRRLRSPAPLRIHLAGKRPGNRLMLNVLKRRGGAPLVTSVQIAPDFSRRFASPAS